MAWRRSEFRRWRAWLPGLTMGLLQRGFDRDAWEKGRQGLDYLENAPQAQEPLEATNDGGSFSFPSELVMYTLIVLLAAAVIYFVRRLIRKGKSGGTKNSRGKYGEAEKTKEFNELTPLDILFRAFEDARKEGRYREALRLLYQIILKKLSTRGLLIADTDKTNREYLKEMRGTPLEGDFAGLTRLHEIGWYGKEHIERVEFDAIVPIFMKFIDKTDET